MSMAVFATFLAATAGFGGIGLFVLLTV